MALFGKKSEAQALPHVMTVYSTGHLRCEGCDALHPLSAFTALSLAPCPTCQVRNFVPLHIGNYWLVSPLGGGGMGAVYKAFHEADLTQEYAVKILPRDKRRNELFMDNLRKEFRIMQEIGAHPCIAGAVDSGEVDGELFLAMYYIPGERLDQRIRRLSKIPEREVVLVGLRLLAGEAHIYNQGYLFRDLKPQNVIVSETGGAYLFDFGICLSVEEALHNDADIIEGSPIYFPPERLTDEGEKVCSEIYSLGMVLYHALSGQPFFTSRELSTIARQHMRAMRLTEAKMRNISPEFAEILTRMIQREQRERYQSFTQVEYDLFRLLQQYS